MKEMIFILSLLILTSHVSVIEGLQHKCIHDTLKHDIRYNDPIAGASNDKGETKRNLQSARNLIITYDKDYNAAFGALSTDKQNYIISAIQVAQQYFNQVITVVPDPGNLVFTGDNCESTIPTPVPSNNAARTGIANSDLHLFVSVTSGGTGATYIAYAGACIMSATSKRPIFGYIVFNTDQIPTDLTDTRIFNTYLDTVVHESTHVLALAAGLFPLFIKDPVTKELYAANEVVTTMTFAGVTTNMLITPKLVKFAQTYFGCPTLTGVALETQGSAGSRGSHWERCLIQDEIMTASSIVGQAAYSQFTLSVLDDSNFYASINYSMANYIGWGKGQGCDFTAKSCTNTATTYQEFCSTSGAIGCDFYAKGVGTCGTDPFSDSCMYTQVASNYFCLDTSNTSQNADLYLDVFSINARCFESTLLNSDQFIPPADGQKCYEFDCVGTTSIKVYLGTNTLLCDSNSQVITDPGTLQGQLTCPSDIAAFCSKAKPCPNYCSMQGYCYNGTCLCLPNLYGPSCQCLKFVFLGNCVDTCPTGSTGDPTTKVCSKNSTCPTGQYQASDGTCQPCKTPCTDCIQSQTMCIACDTTTTKLNTITYTCDVLSCPSGSFLSAGACATCSSSCVTCSGTATTCTSCGTGQTLTNGVCNSGCSSASQYSDSTGTCQNCGSTCATCVTSANNCTSCLSSDQILQNGTCSATCLNSTYRNGNSCVTTCPSGTYANASTMQCTPCFAGCSACSKTATTCSACVVGYNLNTSNSTCVSSCVDGKYYDASSKTCIACSTTTGNCATCITTPTQCLTCVSGTYLKGFICQSTCGVGYYTDTTAQLCTPCQSSGCQTCSNDPSVCSLCSSTTLLYQNSCVNSCPATATLTNSTCIDNSQTTSSGSLGFIETGIAIFVFSLVLLIVH